MSVVGEQSTDRLLELLSRGKLRPTEVRVTKCWDPAAGQLWPPLLPLLKSVGIDVEELHRWVLVQREYN